MINLINLIVESLIIDIAMIILIGILIFITKNKFYFFQYLKIYIKESCKKNLKSEKKQKFSKIKQKVNYLIKSTNFFVSKMKHIDIFWYSFILLIILIIFGLIFEKTSYVIVLHPIIIVFRLLIKRMINYLIKLTNLLFSKCLEMVKLIINYLIKLTNFFIFILMVILGIRLISWFESFNTSLGMLFLEFNICIILLFFLKYILKKKNKNSFFTIEPKLLRKIVKIVFIIIFLICCVSLFIFYIDYKDKSMQNIGIRVTKGKLKDLEDGSIELFLENNKKSFPIKIDDNKKLYIENNDSLFENYNIIKLLFNKENNLSLVTENISKQRLSWELLLPIYYTEIKQVKYFFINYENSRILDRNGKKIDDKISIEGKIIVIENKPNSYIFIGNNSGWGYLDKKIEIETDNFYINILDLVLFLSSIIYFWLKLYGKKSSEYYNKEIINKIKNTSILLDRNKYDKFLTLSMFGLTIPNIWKIVTIKSIGEMNSSIWLKVDLIIYVVLFSILLFCLIISKEISECVKELENEKEEYVDIEYYI